MDEVSYLLVVGVGVDGSHKALFYPEILMEYLGHGCKRVSGARGIGEDFVLGFEEMLVYSQDDCCVYSVLGRGREEYLLCAGLEVFFTIGPGGEYPGGFYGNVHAEVFPGEPGRVLFLQEFDSLAVYYQGISSGFYGALEFTMHRVVLQKECQGFGIGKVIYGYYLYIWSLCYGPKGYSSYPTKAIYAYFDWHGNGSSPFCSRTVLLLNWLLVDSQKM